MIFKKEPDLYIGGKENPYLIRWYVIPRNRFFNIYLHKIVRDDDDRALHDHPWWSISLLLKGPLIEVDNSGSHLYDTWKIRIRKASYAHRLIIPSWVKLRKEAVWTLFFTGPKLREWGFHCPQGWRHWSDFTDESGARVGRGCEE